MNLAIGVVLLWLGSALLYIASHNTGAASPWQVYQRLIDVLGGARG